MSSSNHITGAIATAVMLKRKLDETAEDSGGPENATTSNGQSESDDSNCSNGSTDALAPEVTSGPPPPKRMKKKVNFKGVSVFYFPRRQGFTCVPSEGGSTLGMSEKHSFVRDFTLSDYTKEQKRIHRTVLAEQRRQGKMFPSPLLASSLAPLDNEDVSSGSESDSEYDDYYFLQPLPIRQRRVLLRTAGVRKIDNEEKDDCRDIRVSRNVCGCDCKLFCDPATCSCSLAGIQCQVDRLSFPCGCTKDGCSNSAGRIEFNPIRVRTHFIHTLMRLELERTDSQCPSGKPATAPSSSFSHRSSAAVEHIDVVSANGTESALVSPDNYVGASDDFCSGDTSDASTNDGVKVLKSRLKTKKPELIDLNMFNSNEKGSCRDCQNTDMCNVMMHDVKFSMVNQQQRQQQQQQRVIPTLGLQQGYPGSQGSQLQQHHHHHMSLSPGLSLLHPPSLPPQQQPSSQHMLLFNDGEEEVYRAENTSSMYFDNDDSPYTELSDVSPTVLEPIHFSNVSQASFPGKFHVSPSQMFSSSISAVSSSSSGTVHSQSSGMPKQTSLLNSSCIQSRQANGGCRVGPSSTSCSSVRLEQQQSCGLLAHPHSQQQSAAAMSSQPLLRPSFLSGAPHHSPSQCMGAPGVMATSQGLHPQNGLLSHTHVDNSLELDASKKSMMLQATASGFQNKFAHTDMVDSPVHSTPSTYKLDTPMQTNKSYSPGSSPVAGRDYLSQPSHINFSVPAAVGFGNLATSTVSNEGNANFQSLQTAQHSSCWSTSLASPTLRECLGLGTSPEAAPTSADQRTAQLEISCSSTYQQDACAVTLSPASPNSSTITYATMTTTTRDRLAAHCPGISSHMDGRTEPTTSAVKDSTSSFTNYHMTTDDSDTSSLVGTSQNLLYDLPYPDSSTVGSYHKMNLTLPTAEKNRKSDDPLINNCSNESLSDTSFSQSLFTCPSSASTSFIPKLPNTSHVYSTVIPTCLLPISSSLFPSSSISSSGSCQTYTEETDIFLHDSNSFCEERRLSSQKKDVLGSADEEIKEMKEDSLIEACMSPNRQSASEKTNIEKAHLDIWNTKYSLNEHKEEDMSWKEENKEDLSDVHCGSLSSETPDLEYEQDRNYEGCTTDSEIVSSLSSSTVQSVTTSSASSSSSSPTSEEEKEQAMSQDFGEIIKESIVEMVLV